MGNFLNSNTTSYNNIITNLYFKKIIRNIIEIGNLNNSDKKILDFGCGNKKLSKSLQNKTVLNYDIKPEFSDYNNYHDLDFDVIVINHVLEYFTSTEIIELFENLKKINPKTEIIIGLATRGLLSKILKNLLLQFNAHDNFLNNYQEIVQVIEKYTIQITKPRNICSAKKNFHLQFKQ